MRALILSVALGLGALGMLAVTASDAQAQAWRRSSRFYYPRSSFYYPPSPYYGPRYGSYVTPGYSSYYYGGYPTFARPAYRTYNYGAYPTYSWYYRAPSYGWYSYWP